MGIAAPGQCQVRHVGVEVLLAARAIVLREPDEKIHWTFRPGVSHIVEDPLHPPVTVSAVIAGGTGPSLEVPAPGDRLRFRKVLNAGDPLRSVRSVLAGSSHFPSLQVKIFSSPGEIDINRPSLEGKARFLSYSLNFVHVFCKVFCYRSFEDFKGRSPLPSTQPHKYRDVFSLCENVTRGVWPDLFAGCRCATRGFRCAGRGQRHSPSTTFPRSPPGSLLASRKNLSAIRPRISGVEY